MWPKLFLLLLLAFIAVVHGSIDLDSFENQSCPAANVEDFAEEMEPSLITPSVILPLKFMNYYHEASKIIQITASYLDKSTKCGKDMTTFIRSFQKNEEWALKMTDSFAKFKSGILGGNHRWIGDYHECNNVQAPPGPGSDGFKGLYCSLEIKKKSFMHMPFVDFGGCFPSSCNSTELIDMAEKLLGAGIEYFQIREELAVTQITCQPVDRPFELSTYAMIIFLVAVLFCCIVGTFIEYLEVHRAQNADSNPENGSDDAATLSSSDVTTVSSDSDRDVQTLQKRLCNGSLEFFKCFGFCSNFHRLVSPQTMDDVGVFHGLKILGMTWIILCHVSGFIFPVNTNFQQFFRVLDNWISQLVLNGFYAVDIFFFISGFLVTVSYFRYTEKKKMGCREWLWFYIHRILRIGALYYTFIALYTSDTYAHLGSGPIWHGAEVTKVCRKFWMFNVMFINNFQSTVQQCLQWSWYLANDMQFFAFSPPLLYLLKNYSACGIGSIVSVLLISAVANGYMTYSMELITGLSNMPGHKGQEMIFVEKFIAYFDSIYVRPYSRMAPYLIGLLIGYFYIQKWSRGIRRELSPKVLVMGWIVFGCVVYYSLFGLYRVEPPLWFACVHNALNRHLFAGGMAWLVYICVTGQGGWINSFLSWKHFTVPSRLTYCVYLLHPVLYNVFLFSQGTVDFNYYVMVVYFTALYVISFVVAIPVTLLFESPVMRMERKVRTLLFR